MNKKKDEVNCNDIIYNYAIRKLKAPNIQTVNQEQTNPIKIQEHAKNVSRNADKVRSG